MGCTYQISLSKRKYFNSGFESSSLISTWITSKRNIIQTSVITVITEHYLKYFHEISSEVTSKSWTKMYILTKRLILFIILVQIFYSLFFFSSFCLPSYVVTSQWKNQGEYLYSILSCAFIIVWLSHWRGLLI